MPSATVVAASRATHRRPGPQQVDGEVGVDEAPAPVVEGGADPVAGVGRRQHPGQRRRRLARDQRVAHAHPRRRRALLQERAGHEPDLHGRVVADVLAGREERRRPAGARPREPWRRDQPAGQPQLGAPDAQRRGPHHLDLAGRQGRLDQLDAAPAPQQPGRHPELGDRQRPRDLEGDPGHRQVVPVPEALHGTAQQRRRRPGVLQPRRPRALGELRGQEPARAERKEEGVGHARSLDAPMIVWHWPGPRRGQLPRPHGWGTSSSR